MTHSDGMSAPRPRVTQRVSRPTAGVAAVQARAADLDQQAEAELTRLVATANYVLQDMERLYRDYSPRELESKRLTFQSFRDIVDQAARQLQQFIGISARRNGDAAEEIRRAKAGEAAALAHIDELMVELGRLREENRQLRDWVDWANEEMPAFQQEITDLQATARAFGEERAELNRRCAAAEQEVLRLRKALRQPRETTRLRAVDDSQAQELVRLREELQRTQAERDDLRGKLAEHQSTMLGLVEATEEAKQQAVDARRKADEARREAERQKELVERAKADVAALQSATRLSKNGVPFLILTTRSEIARHPGKTADQLFELFPSPNLGLFLARLSEAAVDHLQRGGSIADFRSVATGIRQSLLDPHFDKNATLPDALRHGVQEARVWFNRLHQHLALTTDQAQRFHVQATTLREERDAVQRLYDALRSDADNAKATLHRLLQRIGHLPDDRSIVVLVGPGGGRNGVG